MAATSAEMKEVARTGLTVLACPSDEETCVVDIVFVHGLQGHPEGTWSYHDHKADPPLGEKTLAHRLNRLFSRKNEESELRPCGPKSVYWPQDILPADCPTARIMTFGYDSDVSKFFEGSVNKNNFYDHANDLLRALLRERKGTTKERPIIFVAHSLGGIIVKQALVDSEHAERRIQEKSIYRCTEHLFFLGTPHRGSSYSDWGKLAERVSRAACFDTNRTIVSHLQIHGLELANLEKDFAILLDKRTFDVFNFQEALGYKGVKGLNGKVVENWSSQIGDHRTQPSESINANHMNMCRFSGREDPGYKQVGGEIQERVNQMVVQRQQVLSEEHADFLRHLIGNVSEESYTGNDIKPPHHGTCQWMLQRRSFCDWLNAEHGVFWVKGNPGAGKSVLMKYLFTDHDQMLEKRMWNTKCIIKAAYFFRVTKSLGDRGTNGMLRALLFQIFQREMRAYQKSLPVLRKLRRNRRTAELIKWTDLELYEIFDNIFRELCGNGIQIRMMFFIDAIDECWEAELEGTLDWLRKLSITARSRNASLGICISSRPLPTLDRDVEAASGWISLQSENRDAIYTYIRTQLASRHDARRRIDYYGRFAQRVAEKADGIFLWVALVVPSLRMKIDNGGTERELEALLNDIPNDLKKLFSNTMERIAESELPSAMRILQIATLVQRRLTLEEFHHALAFQPNSDYASMKDWRNSPDFLEEGQMAVARLQCLSGGLLEVREETEGEVDIMIQYRRFLENTALQIGSPRDTGLERENASHVSKSKLWAEPRQRSLHTAKYWSPSSRNPSRGANLFHTKIGSQKLHPREPSDKHLCRATPSPERSPKGMHDLPARHVHASWSVLHQDTSLRPKFPRKIRVVRFIHETAKYFFLEHGGFQVLSNLIEKANKAKSAANTFCSPAGCFLTGGHEFIANSSTSYLNLTELKEQLREQLGQALGVSYIPRPDEFPFARYISESWLYHLHAAEEGGMAQTHILEWLLSVQASALDQYICWASEHNLTSWIRWCIENEADVNDIDATLVSYGKPIRIAVAHGFHELVRLLIKAGANVNGTIGGSETALRIAERKNDKKMVNLLRANGAVLTQLYWIPPKEQRVVV